MKGEMDEKLVSTVGAALYEFSFPLSLSSSEFSHFSMQEIFSEVHINSHAQWKLNARLV